MRSDIVIGTDYDCTPYIPYLTILRNCELEVTDKDEVNHIHAIGDPCLVKAIVDSKFINENTKKEILDYVKLKYSKSIYGCDLEVEIIPKD